ncbi:hypothetical protein GPX89_33300 [Nocardia sp. ET3-3]|uniref:Uncharacterized protein n=1 Tax=Nocardia terrae TaxID=2675851 RepID=A0A7K1V622_9NOCA|nr:hypothetical protein [Nocardia terrae]MVU82103.1 hypothetical protein [Nocardia terrae]
MTRKYLYSAAAAAALCTTLALGGTATADPTPSTFMVTTAPVVDSGSVSAGSAASYGVSLIQTILMQTGSSGLARSLDQLACTLAGRQFSDGTCIGGGI